MLYLNKHNSRIFSIRYEYQVCFSLRVSPWGSFCIWPQKPFTVDVQCGYSCERRFGSTTRMCLAIKTAENSRSNTCSMDGNGWKQQRKRQACHICDRPVFTDRCNLMSSDRIISYSRSVDQFNRMLKGEIIPAYALDRSSKMGICPPRVLYKRNVRAPKPDL